ncbi:hypothetical protein FEM03_01465 [Phragmitibacter flavus]|uniref:Uncharacterized protein n=1 Tax=Phragmitibacter flavus TaxID=2576071 RepID=A0A5R8KKK2_9BACT|nr:hypothetical protein [Phragmitibacter flavus]TLD72770.1 hypothetical protein FEM03_01465 [Phragmitibacter flavus]
MSDPNHTQPVQPLSTKTGSVPLKKETVRITLRARPGAGLTQKQPTVPQTATAPVSLQQTAPVQLPAPANKATASIQLPSSPLPPPAARPATAPVAVMQTAPVSLPPASRATAVVKLSPATAPVMPVGSPRPPAPAPGGAPRPPGAPPAPSMGAPRPPGAPPAPMAPRPAGGAPPPPGAPRPPGAPPGPLAPTIPMAKAPGAPVAPTAAPRPPGAPPAAMPPPGAKMEAGAATVPLAKGPVARPGAPGAAPVAKPGGATSQLPKATVQLNKGPGAAAAAGAPKPMAQANVPIKRPLPPSEENAPLYEEKDPEAGLMPLAVVCTVLGVAIMVLSMFGSDKFFYGNPGEVSALKVPPPILPKWEQPAGDGTYVSSFNKALEDITRKFE